MGNVWFGDLHCGAAVTLPHLQNDAASAIAACAQVWFVRIVAIYISHAERLLSLKSCQPPHISQNYCFLGFRNETTWNLGGRLI